MTEKEGATRKWKLKKIRNTSRPILRNAIQENTSRPISMHATQGNILQWKYINECSTRKYIAVAIINEC